MKKLNAVAISQMKILTEDNHLATLADDKTQKLLPSAEQAGDNT